MTTLGAWLKGQGFTVDDNNVPLGRESRWQGVSFLTIHHTASPCTGPEQDIATYCRVGGKGTYPPLCQIMLGNSGKVWMTCRERSGQKDPGRASHAGNGSGFGVAKDSMNEHSLGIEVQCDGSHKLATHTTQYQTLIRLTAALCRRYNVPTKNVIGHKEWSTTGKVDPRDDMNKIRADVAKELAGTATKNGPYITQHVYRSKCGFGEPTNGDANSDTVKELQERLKRASLTGAVPLTVDGKYGVDTDTMVRLWQEQTCGDTPDPARKSYLGPKQFAFMFPDAVYTLHDDGDPAIASGSLPPPTLPTPPKPEVPAVTQKHFIYRYSGKPTTTQTIGTSYVPIDLSRWTPPGDGLLIVMQYVNCKYTLADGIDSAGLRLRAVREQYDPGSGLVPVDNSAYQDYSVTRHTTDPGTFLVTHLWFEMCEGRRPIHFEADRSSKFTAFELGTRYTKHVWISSTVLDALGKNLGLSANAVGRAITTYLASAQTSADDLDMSDAPREISL